MLIYKEFLKFIHREEVRFQFPYYFQLLLKWQIGTPGTPNSMPRFKQKNGHSTHWFIWKVDFSFQIFGKYVTTVPLVEEFVWTHRVVHWDHTKVTQEDLQDEGWDSIPWSRFREHFLFSAFVYCPLFVESVHYI